MNKPSTLVRIVIGLVLSVISGLAFLLAFPPYGIWPLIWIGWVPVLLAQYRVVPTKFSRVPPAVASFVWLQGYLGPVFGGSGNFMEYLPAAIFFIVLLTEGSSRPFNERTRYRWFVLQGSITSAAIEMIRLFIPIAGTWGFIAYAHYEQPWLIQPVSIFGIIGMGFLIILVNYALTQGAIWLFDQRWHLDPETTSMPPRRAQRWLVGAGAGLAVWAGLSLLMFRTPTTDVVRVAAIQPDASPIIAAFQGEAARVAALHTRMVEQTREAARQGAAFIVWPEGALQYDPQVSDSLGLVDLAQELGVYLAVGYVVEASEGTFRNEATVIDPSGAFLGVFGKDHPVVFAGETSATRGAYPVYDTPLGKLATIICYDQDYTDTTQRMARQGAELVAVPSNDWSGIADKHYAHTVFRAAENRVAMVKSDGGFDSAVIDPHGRILTLAVEPKSGEATLISDVALGSGRGTLTSHLSDWFGWLSLVGLAFFTLGASWLTKLEDARSEADVR
jgi:apolipoprotein N-acyltransferase